MPRRSLRLVLLALLSTTLPFVSAQTNTVPNPNGNGGSIVQVVTTDIDGLPVTQKIDTIPPGAAAPTAPVPPGGQDTTATTATTPVDTDTLPLAAPTTTPPVPTTQAPPTQAPQQQGPVLQPGPTVAPGEGVTSYQYTTVDGLGQTTVIHDIFTPTYNTPSPQSSPKTGTVLSPSQWSAIIGTHTAGGPTGAGESWRITRTGMGGMIVMVFGVVAGAWVVL